MSAPGGDVPGDSPQQPPPGWYPDASGQPRWWDGHAWGAAAPAPSGGPTDERGLATLAQVLAIFTGFVGPLIVYLVCSDQQRFAKHHAAEALNFQITVTIAAFVSFLLIFVAVGIVLFPLVIIAALVFEVIASVAANRGEWYRFPISLRLVSGAVG